MAESKRTSEQELRDYLAREYGFQAAAQDEVIRTIAAAALHAAEQAWGTNPRPLAEDKRQS